ncbi:MAG: glycosyltransferase [Lentisphaeria bacterium]|nr:glycosyltransferase [Lentisphaeria bacterium]
MISVVIPAYNTALLIERTIRSVLAQSCQDFEILIVDDCSTDNTLDVVKSIKDERIRIFEQPENRGPAAARNRGLAEAKGEYCAFLDGDDYWESDFLKETSGFLDSHPDAVAVSVMQCHKIIGKSPVTVPRDTGVTKPMVLPDFFAFWAKYNHVCTGSVLMRSSIARQLGGQREDLRICEDLEFWALLATQGKWGFIPKVLFTSDGGAVTKKQGWRTKNMRRWQSAPPADDWAKRITAAFQGNVPDTFASALGRVARNLCYSHIMAGKTGLARQEVLKYGRNFPKNRLNAIFQVMAKNCLLWAGFCCLLKIREYLR